MEDLQTEMEKYIDVHGLKALLDLVSTICTDKADHVMSIWGDKELYKAWEKDAWTIAKAGSKLIDVMGD